MPSNAQTLVLGFSPRSIVEVLANARKAFAAAPDILPAGEYSLTQWNHDHTEGHVVAWRRGLSRESMPVVEEQESSFNDVSFSMDIDTQSGQVEGAEFGVTAYPQGCYVHLVFMGDVLQSLGAGWVTKTVGVLMSGLGFESAILCDRTEDGATERRVIAGESLTQIIAARVKGEDPLPPPLLAFVKVELCGDDIWAVTRDRGVKVRMTTKGLMVFSTVDS